MFDENVQVVDWHYQQMDNFFNLFTSFQEEQKKMLAIIYRGEQALKIIDSQQHSYSEMKQYFQGPKSLPQLAQRIGAEMAIALEEKVMRKIMEKQAERISIEDGYGKQLFYIVENFIKEIGRNIHFFPSIPRPFLWISRMIKYPIVDLLVRFSIPKNSSLALFVFRDNEIYFSWILEFNKQREISMVTTSEGLEEEDLKVDNYRKDYQKIIDAVEKKFNHVFMGIFLNEGILKEMINKGKEALKILSKAKKKREIILKPFPLKSKIFLRMARLFIR